MTNWTINHARQTYNIAGWGKSFFDINDEGHVIAKLNGKLGDQNIDLFNIVQQLKAQGLSPPILVRFPDILHHRITALNEAFAAAIQTHQYLGSYTAVYPIKVNQQYSVVKEISRYDKSPIGLEAGSKTELMAVLGLADAKSGIIVCNGYKDREYIRTAFIGLRMGHTLFLVIEKLSELDLIAEESRKMKISPLLGVRIKLSAAASGKWQNSGGEKSKFGLSTLQLLQSIAKLKHLNLLQNLKLLHFHLGSQITDIHDIQQCMAESARYFAELRQYNITIDYIDVGGGLSVDYEGTASRNYFSMNYDFKEYAHSIVGALATVCNPHGVKHPHILSESGRAITAHHTILITNVIDVDLPPDPESCEIAPTADCAELNLLQHYYSALDKNSVNPIEVLHKTAKVLSDINVLFSNGIISLSDKSIAEKIHYKISTKAHRRLQHANRDHRDTLDELNEKLAHKYFCNFSIFQSLPDVWAINQIFPIVPLHRLDEKPCQQGILLDITCDSDGQIYNYVDELGVSSSLPLHKFNAREPYYIGIFLVGAYQEILGDMHNLFGDTNSVNFEKTIDGYQLTHSQHGDSVDYVLQHIHFKKDYLITIYQKQLAATNLSQQDQDIYMKELSNSILGYTYLED